MDVAAIISRVRRTAGDIDVLQFEDADIIRWINDAMRECASDNQLLQVRATSTTSVGTAEYGVPTDILKLHSVLVDGQKLPVVTLDEYDSHHGSTLTSGTPVGCYIWAGKITLFPIPDQSAPLVINYTRNPTEVAVATDVPELPVSYHQRLVDYCLAQVAQQDDDMTRYQMKMDEFRTGVQNLKDHPEWENNLYPTIAVAGADLGGWDGYYGE